MDAGELRDAKPGKTWFVEWPDKALVAAAPAGVPGVEVDAVDRARTHEQLRHLREQTDELRQDRDAWRDRAQQAMTAEAELRRLLAQAQQMAMALPASRDQGAYVDDDVVPERIETAMGRGGRRGNESLRVRRGARSAECRRA